MDKTDENMRKIQNKLTTIINKNSFQKNKIEIVSYKSNITERIHNLESNYAFLELLEPLLRDKKILDLFCGTNSIKQYSSQNHLKTKVTGVDNSEINTYSDIKSDVKNMPTTLKPKCQFDIITSFGGTNSENYSHDYNYLKKDGLLIHGYSKQFFIDNNIESQLNCDKTEKKKNIKELLKYFRPIIIINVIGIHQIIKWPSQTEPIELSADLTYIIFRKR